MVNMSLTKADFLAAEKAARQDTENVLRADDPTQGLEFAQEYMEKILSVHIKSGDELALYFVSTTIPRIVSSLLNRSDFDEELDNRVFRFLELVLVFIARTIDTGYPPLAALLLGIFSESSHAFYMHNSSRATCEDIPEIGETSESAFENEAYLVEAVFAETTSSDYRGSSGRFVSMINFFGRSCGFSAIRDEILSRSDPPSLLRIKALLAPLYEIKDFLTVEFINWFMGVREKMCECVLSLTDEELKNDFRVATEVVQYICALHRYTTHPDNYKIVDTFRLDFALKGFRSPFLERRLTGLSDITDFLESFQQDTQGSLKVKDMDEWAPVWATPEYMCEWLMKNQILESLFSRNVHAEVLKRCNRVLLFLSSHRHFGEREAELIWNASMGKHESVQKIIHELLCELARLQRPSVLRLLVSLMQPLKLSEYTLQHVELLRTLSVQLIEQGSKEEGCDYKYDGARLLWQLIQDDAQFTQAELKNCCMHYFLETIEHPECRPIRNMYLAECVQNLRAHRSVPQSLTITTRLFFSVGGKRKRTEVDWSTFDCLRDEKELLDLVIDDLVEYQKRASKMVQQLQRLGEGDINLQTMDGMYCHQEHLEKRLQFLTNLLELPANELTTDMVDIMWDTLVSQALTEKQRDTAYRWFEITLANSITRHSLQSSAEHLFNNLLCRCDLATLSDVGFLMFRYYMKFINWQMGRFQEHSAGTGLEGSGRPFMVKNFEIAGTPVLWELAVSAESETLAGEAMSFLIDLHQHLSPELADRLAAKREEFVDNCMKHLLQTAAKLKEGGADASRHERRVGRCIRMLTTFLHDSESKMRRSDAPFEILKHGLRHRGDPVSLKVQKTGSTMPDTHRVVLSHMNSTLFSLRKEIGGILGEDFRSLRLFARGSEMRDDSKTISESRLSEGDLVHVMVPLAPRHKAGDADMQGNGTVKMMPDVDVGHALDEAAAVHNTPHYILSKNYFPQLFQLLEAPSHVASQVWNLLMELPTNDKLLASLSTLAPGWTDSLGVKESVHTMWYSLEIVEALLEEQEHGGDVGGAGLNGDMVMTDTEQSRLGTWRARFVQQSGVGQLVTLLMTEKFSAPQTEQGFACLSLLLNIVFQLIINDDGTGCGGRLDQFFENDSQLEGFVHRLMHVFGFAASCVESVQDVSPERDSSSEVYRKDFMKEKVAREAMQLLERCVNGSIGGCAKAVACIYRFPDLRGWVTHTLLHCQTESIRKETARGLMQIIWPNESEIATCSSDALTTTRPSSNTDSNGPINDESMVHEQALDVHGPTDDEDVTLHHMRSQKGIDSRSVVNDDSEAKSSAGIQAQGSGVASLLQNIKEIQSPRARTESLDMGLGGVRAWGGLLEGMRDMVWEGVCHPHRFFLEMLLDVVCSVQAPRETCEQFFDLLNQLLRKTESICSAIAKPQAHPAMISAVLSETFAALLDRAVHMLVVEVKERPTLEKRGKQWEDTVLQGILQTLECLFRLRPHLKVEHLASSGNLVRYIFFQCLFDTPSVDEHLLDGPPKCKLPSTRKAAFQLLQVFVQECPGACRELLDAMKNLHEPREVRSLHFYQPSQLDKAPCGYVGLSNLGATCYMNSLLQQLYHIPEFRAEIFKVPAEVDSENLIFQLQTLFGYLQESDKQFFDTSDFCQAYKDYDGQPVNTTQQMDVDEYFNVLFDRLEAGLKGTPQEHVLQECFGGKVVNQIICKEPVCVGSKVFGLDDPFKSEREETFFTLRLEVKHKRNILKSLDLFVDGEVLEGDNKYLCEEANKKVEAVKRVCISQLPRTLILHLKRFEFDLDFMKKVKVNDSCEFPTYLNMDPYTREGIERREKAVVQAVKDGMDPTKAAAKSLWEQVESPEDSGYFLVGVLVHAGTADSGHYYSYIKERGSFVLERTPSEVREHAAFAGEDWQGNGPIGRRTEGGRWFLFNDTHVEPFDDKEIGAACFGGNEYVQQDSGGAGQSQMPKCVPRMYNAYLLFYERVGTGAGRERMDRLDGRVRVDVPDGIMRNVWKENIQFLSDKHIFDSAYFSFVHQVADLGVENGRLLEMTAAGRNSQENSIANDVMKFCVRFLMDTVMHSWNTAQVATWVELIKSLLVPEEQHLWRCRWLLTAFCEDLEVSEEPYPQHWLREGLLRCRVQHKHLSPRNDMVRMRLQDARVQIVNLLTHAIRVLAPFEAHRKGCVPHCREEFPNVDMNVEEMEEYETLLKIQPLLTDRPYQRTYPGGLDPSLTALSDYVPFPQAITTVGQFLDCVLSLLPELPTQWRNMGQYFQLLSEVVNVGTAEKAFLLSRRAISRCIDCFLHGDSPFAASHKYGIRMGDKFGAPNFKFLPQMVADLLCSVRLNLDLDDLPQDAQKEECSPVQQECAGVIDEACLNLVRHKVFLTKLLTDEVNPRAAQQILLHLSWKNPKMSDLVLQWICEVVEEVGDEEYGVLFELLFVMLSIEDGIEAFRAERFVIAFVHALDANFQYTDACIRCLEFLAQNVATRPIVRQNVIKLVLEGPKRRDVRFLEPILVRDSGEAVRAAAENLVRVLAFPGVWSATPVKVPTTTKGGMKLPDEPTRKFVDHMFLSMDVLLQNSQAVGSSRTHSPSRLVQYFRSLHAILRACIAPDTIVAAHTATPRTNYPDFAKSLIRRHISSLMKAFDRINTLNYEMDANKCELLKVILYCAQECREALEHVSESPEPLMSNFIMVRQTKMAQCYNRHALPVFYRLIQLCCQHSKDFLDGFVTHRNAAWAIDTFLLSGNKFPEVGVVLQGLLDLSLRAGSPAGVANLRKKILSSIVTKFMNTSPLNCILVLNKILVSSLDDAIFILRSSALGDLIDFINAEAEQQSGDHGVVAALKIQQQSVKALHRLIVGGLSNAAVTRAAVQENMKAVKTRLELIISLFASMVTTSITPVVRGMCMDLVGCLCELDTACSAVGVEQAIQMYSECKLVPFDDEHQRGGKYTGRGGLFPAVRELNKENEEKFFVMMGELCRLAVMSATPPSEASDLAAAVRLLLSCSIDALTSNDELLNPFSNLLLDVTTGRGFFEDKEEAFRDVVVTDGYLAEWLRRICLVFNHHLLNDNTRKCAEGMARMSCPKWGSRDIARFNETIVHGIQSIKRHKEGEKHETSVNRPTLSLQENVLVSILPLLVVCATPILLADMASRDEGALVEIVRKLIDGEKVSDDSNTVARIKTILEQYASSVRSARK